LHPTLPLPHRLVGIVRTVVEITMLARLDTRPALPFGSPIARQSVGDDDPRGSFKPLSSLQKNVFAAVLHPDSEDVPILLDGPPEIRALALECQTPLIEVPRIAWPGTLATELSGILLTKFAAPLADRFVRHEHAPGTQQGLTIARVQAAAEIPPHTLADDRGREAVGLGTVSR
jgi:hypothetical protein